MSTDPVLPTDRRTIVKWMGNSLALAAGAPLANLSLAQTITPTPLPSQIPKKPIRIGQIGVGHAHASKLSVYRASPDYEVVGIVEPDRELRKKAESQPPFRDLKWMTQEELLRTPDLQGVLIETRVRDSLQAAEAAIDAGKHIHLDKPAGESLQQFARILEKGERAKLLVQMGYMYRYNPAVQLLKTFLKNQWLGEIFEVHTVMSKVLPPQDRLQQSEYRGGMMFELGCHVLDLVIDILGEPTEVKGYSQHSSKLEDTLLDNMLAVLLYPKSIATVKSSANEVDGTGRRHLVVCGTEGTFHIQPLDNPTARITLSKRCGDHPSGTSEATFPKYVRYVEDAADMARILRGEKVSDFSYRHDLTVQSVLLQACGL